MKRILTTAITLPLLAAATWGGYGAYLAASQPRIVIDRVASEAVEGEKTLPFYELMSPVPSLGQYRFLPKLEYKKGPPRRFIERITLLVKGEGTRERIVYHGRRTRNDLPLLSLFSEEASPEGRYIEAGILLSQGRDAGLPLWKEFVLKPLLLREAGRWIANADSVEIMEQAGSPAFLFTDRPGPGGSVKAEALFVRRNSFYRVDYYAEAGFRAVNPSAYFRKTFLVEKRGDAVDYLAKNLAAVRLEQKEVTAVENIAWPILLLAANVSVDPASLDAYFHFAGISALLYRSLSAAADGETLDILRNNVLAADFYARDVSPKSPRTAEIGRLARLLTRNFE